MLGKPKETYEEPELGDGEGEKQEYFDTPSTLERKVKHLAELIRGSKHCVFHTGAGISTSLGVPDFRGPTGVWTLQEAGVGFTFDKDWAELCPSEMHMTILSLLDNDYCKYLVSQNVDGLHLRSGVDPEIFSELHGNSFIESCRKCGTVYLRDFAVSSFCGKDIPREVLGKMSFREIQHLTGRLCGNDSCDGFLQDSIINFGENLPEEALSRAQAHSKKADLSIVVGSSLTVRPASSLPKMSKQVVIINLQKTPLDSNSKVVLRIWAKSDEVAQLLREELGINVKEWTMPPASELRLRCMKEQMEENAEMDRKMEERRQRAAQRKDMNDDVEKAGEGQMQKAERKEDNHDTCCIS